MQSTRTIAKLDKPAACAHNAINESMKWHRAGKHETTEQARVFWICLLFAAHAPKGPRTHTHTTVSALSRAGEAISKESAASHVCCCPHVFACQLTLSSCEAYSPVSIVFDCGMGRVSFCTPPSARPSCPPASLVLPDPLARRVRTPESPARKLTPSRPSVRASCPPDASARPSVRTPVGGSACLFTRAHTTRKCAIVYGIYYMTTYQHFPAKHCMVQRGLISL